MPVMGYHLVRVLAEPINGVAEAGQLLMDRVHPRPAQGGQMPADLHLAIPELGLIIMDIPNHDVPDAPNPHEYPFRPPALNLPKPLTKGQNPPHAHPPR